MSGTLYVVATPIGNLEDVTFRALRTLREADLIAAEDTRRTGKLLAHYEIRRPVMSLREHNEVRETPRLVEKLKRGERIALVSDAGTPAIADPGARLVRAAREAGIKVVPVPGASAITAALSVAGLASTEFVFKGFPPPGGNARREWFAQLAREPRAVVFFEAPHRLLRTVAEASNYVERPIQVHREISKIHEELVETPINNKLTPVGEFVLIIEPHRAPLTDESDIDSAEDLFWRLTKGSVFQTEEALKIAAKANGLMPRDVRRFVKKRQILAKRQSDTSG